jgi:hypothetical protein
MYDVELCLYFAENPHHDDGVREPVEEGLCMSTFINHRNQEPKLQYHIREQAISVRYFAFMVSQ